MEVPYFHNKNLAEFCVWCAMAHRQGFMPMYMAHASMLVLRWARAPQSTKHIDTCRIHWETNVIQVTWIETITPQWSRTQYSVNMHLQQVP